MLAQDQLKEVLKLNEKNGNYKVMCEKLNEPIKNGKGKTLQQSDWLRYFNYYKDGHQFIVTEIYDVTLEKIDKRSEGNNSIFKGEMLDDLLLPILMRYNQSGIVVLTRNILYEELGLVPKHYKYNKRSQQSVSELQKIKSKAVVAEFYEKIDGSLRTIIETALNRLVRKELITYTDSRIKVIRDTDINLETKYLCTEDELEIISKVEKELCEKYNCKNTFMISRLKVKEQIAFYDELQQILNEKYNIGYTYGYHAYKIILKKNFYQLEIPYLEQEEHYAKQLEVNKIFITRMRKKTTIRLVKANEKNIEFQKFKKFWKENNNKVIEYKGNLIRPLGIPIQGFTEYRLDDREEFILSDEYQKGFNKLTTTLYLPTVKTGNEDNNELEVIIPKKIYNELDLS
ncbi:hypothetical protein [Turicibacter sanguinis]|uniref:hypothetical protein n=1 Tax=Turicibacter sanguinis TaxID=154288 RepID=UPI00294370A9|nr:hypothetical protein [Turicibacter sanguinis]